LDWRAKNAVSGIRDQGQCGSCWAFAMTQALESSVMIARKSSEDVSLSEQVLLACSGGGSCEKGGYLNADFLRKTGLPPASYYPYTATNGKCANAKAGWREHVYKIGAWNKVQSDLAAIKSALVTHGPLPTAFLVMDDFRYYKSGVYSYTQGKSLGGHAVLLVGYDDDGRYFIVKNSWGPGWGEGGFFRIAYSEMNDAVNFGDSTIAYTPGKAEEVAVGPEAAAVSDEAPQDLKSIADKLRLGQADVIVWSADEKAPPIRVSRAAVLKSTYQNLAAREYESSLKSGLTAEESVAAQAGAKRCEAAAQMTLKNAEAEAVVVSPENLTTAGAPGSGECCGGSCGCHERCCAPVIQGCANLCDGTIHAGRSIGSTDAGRQFVGLDRQLEQVSLSLSDPKTSAETQSGLHLEKARLYDKVVEALAAPARQEGAAADKPDSSDDALKKEMREMDEMGKKMHEDIERQHPQSAP
jgi:hypothetical protein